MSRAWRIGLAVLVLVGAGGSAHAARNDSSGPREHRTSVRNGKIVTPGFAIDFVGVLWVGNARGGKIRFRARTNRWTSWQPLLHDEIEVPGRFASTLLAANGATAYQVRVPGLARGARAVAMNTTTSQRRIDATSGTGVVTRAQWGADESLRFDGQGNESWPPAYYPAQTITVHHTATRNGDADPAATVRAIYRYHAIDQGWGDIGYHYLIDEQGRVYEGRYSGADGDPAHDPAGEVVTAAHVGGWNSGNLGVALLGTLRTKQPTAAARNTLETLLAELAARHGLDPLGRTLYVNPITAATKDVDVISGHRDWDSTECPGTAFYKQLPSVRTNVAGLLAPPPTTGTVHVADLDGLATSQGRMWSAEVTIAATDDNNLPVANATATGTWSIGTSSTCSTDAEGRCTVGIDRLRGNVTSATLTVTALVASGRTYEPSANTDPDGDSTGSSITVTRP